VTVAPLAWTSSTKWSAGGGPEAREHGAFLVDQEGARAILVGGSGYAPYGTPLSDAWSFALPGLERTALTLAGDLIPAGASRRVAQDPGSRTAYLFGGYGVNGTTNNELYRVDLAADPPSVKKLTQTMAPTKRALHAFAYDRMTDRFFVFGGSTPTPMNDLWVGKLTGDSMAWQKVTVSPRPTPRYGFFAGADSVAGKLYVFSGAQKLSPLDPARDIWVLDMHADPPAWTLLGEGEAAAVPPGRRNGCAVFDPAGPRLFVSGGTADAMTTEKGLFVFDARESVRTWTRLDRPGEPAVRSSGFGFVDPVTGRVLAGFGNTSSAVFSDLNAIGYSM
jgi:hypothetical protein